MVQILFDKPGDSLRQDFPRESVSVDEMRSDERVISVDWNGHGPVVRVHVAQQNTARNHLIVKYHLAVVAGIDLAQLIVTRFQY